MLKHEFGIIASINKDDNFIEYCPQKYDCISVSDKWMQRNIEKIKIIPTFFNNLNRPSFGLAYHGITIIPPSSISILEKIISEEKSDESTKLLKIIKIAILKNKYIIHFGI